MEVAVIAVGGLIVALLVGALLAVLAYWLVGLFAPHPVPVIVALLIFVVVVFGNWL